MTTTVTLRHNFEAGHRLPHLPGKCQSLHGHSWWAEVTISGELSDDGILVDFGAAKKVIRSWIDTHLDHGLILGTRDPLRELLMGYGKVYTMPTWPTVELVAVELAAELQRVFDLEGLPGLITRVHVTEKHDNAATWVRS